MVNFLCLISNDMAMNVPESHPRYESLLRRDRLIEGFRNGIVAEAGLIAHGRGEALDYLIGEKTNDFAEEAERVSAFQLLNASNPIISVNGNVAALCPKSLIELASTTGAALEVNLFYRTEERIAKIVEHLENFGAQNVLGAEPDAQIPGLEHARALCTESGIFSADVILVPLEDGDRAQALRDMGKTTIVIDLNPLSRSSKVASVSIVDEVTRAIPNVTKFAEEIKASGEGLSKTMADFDNERNLAMALEAIRKGF